MGKRATKQSVDLFHGMLRELASAQAPWPMPWLASKTHSPWPPIARSPASALGWHSFLHKRASPETDRFEPKGKTLHYSDLPA